jgi:hypothetical protein
MRSRYAVGALVAALTLVGGVAHAQDKPKPKYKPQPLILRKERLGTEAFVSAGRARMRNGDCAGALEAFDAALRTSMDPTINRDRGLCHERLGDAYPAIDDYRVYLTAEPDAPDAPSIRQRLANLEQQTLGHSSASSEGPEFSASAGATAATAEPGQPGQKRDRLETVEHDHEEAISPLRRGTGMSLGPFVALHKWFTSTESGFGDNATWSESIGLAFRWSVGSGGALLVEAGYEHFNETVIATIQGLTSQVGFEFRIPLDPAYDNQFLIVPGLGYEFIEYSPNQVAGASSENGGALVPRLRLGWRHMVTASSGFDLALDGGAKAVAHGSFLTQSTTPSAVLLAVNAAFHWGF